MKELKLLGGTLRSLAPSEKDRTHFMTLKDHLELDPSAARFGRPALPVAHFKKPYPNYAIIAARTFSRPRRTSQTTCPWFMAMRVTALLILRSICQAFSVLSDVLMPDLGGSSTQEV
jgi:hypothetical protein